MNPPRSNNEPETPTIGAQPEQYVSRETICIPNSNDAAETGSGEATTAPTIPSSPLQLAWRGAGGEAKSAQPQQYVSRETICIPSSTPPNAPADITHAPETTIDPHTPSSPLQLAWRGAGGEANRRRVRHLALAALAVAAIAATACGAPPGPRGWAGAQPVTAADGDVILAAHKSRLYALPAGSSSIAWTFPPRDRDSYLISRLNRDALIDQVDATGVSDEVATNLRGLVGDLAVDGPTGETLKKAIDTARDNSTDDAIDGRLNDLKKAVDKIRADEKKALTKVRALYGEIAVSEDGATAFVPTYGGWLFSVDVETGQTNWIYDASDGMVGGATVDGDTVYVGTKGDELLAINATTAELEWSFRTGGEVWAAPAVVDGAIYVSSLDGTLHKLDDAGQEQWSFSDAGSGVASRPVVDGDSVYIGSFDNKLYAIDTETGDMRWYVEAGNWFWGAPAIEGDTVYAASLDGNLYAIDSATGDVNWKFDAGAPMRSSPVIAGGGVVIATREGEVHKVDAETGQPEGAAVQAGSNVEANLTADDDDIVYAVPRDSTLYVIDASGALAVQPIELP